MFQPSKLLRVVLIIVGVLAVMVGFTFWSWDFTTSRLHASAQSFGVFPSPAEAMMTEIRDGYVGIQEAWIRSAKQETAPGGGPHVWFVTACIWAETRIDGSTVGTPTHDFDFPGSYYMRTHEGWVLMPETSLPLFVGFWMKIFGLAGDGGGGDNPITSIETGVYSQDWLTIYFIAIANSLRAFGELYLIQTSD